MKVLIVHAHPEPQSFTAALRDQAIATLQAQGHEVMRSDLYAMGWKAVFDAQDFPERVQRDRLSFIDESRHAFAQACQTADVQAEQHKLQEADAVILHFPLWWFSMPAIMKGCRRPQRVCVRSDSAPTIGSINASTISDRLSARAVTLPDSPMIC